MPSRRGPWARGLLCLALLSTTACASLLEGVVRSVADEGPGSEGPPAPPREASPEASRAAPPVGPNRVEEGPKSTYESAPMMGLSTQGFARPFSVMGSLFDGPSSTVCRPVARRYTDVLDAPDGSPVNASAPLGLRVSGHVVPVYDFFIADRDLRSARAFQSGARLASGGPTCGRSFSFYLGFSLGWNSSEPVAVSR